ncbi:Endoglycoceramidase [Hondaea fermentalgiana]|uniref:Endoglycoceramidase n=1 Tax=Hondaea fermentalgiana TaxID=2315210 RepID=A0A2R5GB48_9STRA|nr:Endoglycoceramidase [Hondaea fermentalgiana]|eukprot:GBG28236.1 Endoglycoceramidase [Hondaea fermentalgiana]
MSTSTLAEADEYHLPSDPAARSPLRRNPTLLRAEASSLSTDETGEETAALPRWTDELKAGSPTTRSVVVHEPGFYVLRFAAMHGGLKSAETKGKTASATTATSAGNAESESGKRESLEEMARSLSTRKRLSKRERFRAKMASFRSSTTSTSLAAGGAGANATSAGFSSPPSSSRTRGVKIDIRVRDVHHLAVVVLNSFSADAEPSLEDYASYLQANEASNGATINGSGYGSTLRLRSSSADEALPKKQNSPGTTGSIVAASRKKKKPKTQESAIPPTRLVLSSEGGVAATGSSSFYLDPSNVPAIIETSMKTFISHIVVSELFVSFQGAVLGAAVEPRQRRSSSLNAIKTPAGKFSQKNDLALRLGSGRASLRDNVRPQSARNSKRKSFNFSVDDIEVRPLDRFADSSDAHSEGEPEGVDLADRLLTSFTPQPDEVTIAATQEADPESPPAVPPAGSVATSNRHRRAMSLFARYSDMTTLSQDEDADDGESEEGPEGALFAGQTLASEEDDNEEDEAAPTEHVEFASKRKPPRRRKLSAKPAHVSAMATPEMSPAGLPQTPFERIWEDLGDSRSSVSFHELNRLLRDVPIKLKPLVTQGRWFYEFNGPGEPLGRAVLLRGVNLSGNVKLPFAPDSRSHVRVDWGTLKDPAAAAALSFVGRPFPLEEAHEHFSRLRRWGFNCFRFLVTWEAIEHAGPGQYDAEYLDYVEAMVRIAGTYGFYAFIDPHQDVWSRMTGGSGAPAWTLTAAGLDLSKLEASEATFTHNAATDPAKFQRMSWPQNYQRFAAAHMFTLFWGGNDFAPEFAVAGGIPIQEYLQRHFIDAMLQVAYRVKDMPHVVGFDSFNEPSPGFIGSRLDGLPEVIIPPGPVFRPIDAMVTAAGHTSSVGRANSIGLITGRYKANPTQTRVWREGVADVWEQHGVYDVQTTTNENGAKVRVARILQNEYFCNFPRGSASVGKVEFFRDYLRPFMVLYISRIRALMPRAILFAEGDGFGEKEFVWDHADPRGVVNASHWYDGFTLFTANFNPRFSVDVSTKLPVFGASRIYNMHMRDLKAISELPRALDGARMEMPTLIGEFGIPFNMNNKYGFKTGDFRMHERAMSVYYDVMDALQLHSTQWNYCGDNCNDWGDNWNLEDLSLFSRDQQSESADKDIESGGRGTRGFSRPFAPFVCGMPTLTLFQRRARSFEHSYEPNPRNFEYGNLEFGTEIFVPDIQYVARATSSVVQFDVVVEGGKFKMLRQPGRHILYVWADQEALEASNHMKCVTIRIFFPIAADASG